MPEWMDDNNEDESNATFEQDGTFTGSSSLRQNSNEQPKLQSQSSTDETSSRGNVVSDKKKIFDKFQLSFLFEGFIKTTRR